MAHVRSESIVGERVGERRAKSNPGLNRVSEFFTAKKPRNRGKILLGVAIVSEFLTLGIVPRYHANYQKYMIFF